MLRLFITAWILVLAISPNRLLGFRVDDSFVPLPNDTQEVPPQKSCSSNAKPFESRCTQLLRHERRVNKSVHAKKWTLAPQDFGTAIAN